MSKATEKAAHPDFPWLEAGECHGIFRFMQRRNWLLPDESVTACEAAGEGNMNLTLRVETTRRSLILKQARPWVEKYDHLPAPWDRVLFEQRFYERVKPIADVAGRMPQLLAVDTTARTILLEDLPNFRDMTDLYRGGRPNVDELDELATYACTLHESTCGGAEPGFENWDMRALNHHHIFVVPLEQASDLELDNYEPGLTDAAQRLAHDDWFARQLHDVGERYLAVGRCLVHGDFFPGSWLRSSGGVRVIDPEFCFYGDPEFDVGVAIAHLALAQQSKRLVERFLERYSTGTHHIELSDVWLARYAAAEVVRRLIGVAQLPIPLSRGLRAHLLNRAHQTMKDRTWETLWADN